MLDIQKGSLTRMLKALIELNLISRENDQNDDRKYYLTLTDSGGKFFLDHQRNCDDKLSVLFADMSSPDKNKLEDGLKVLNSYFKYKGEKSENDMKISTALNTLKYC